MAKEGTPKETDTEPSDTTPTVTEGEIKFPSPTSIKLSKDMQSENMVETPPIPIRRPNPKKDQ